LKEKYLSPGLVNPFLTESALRVDLVSFFFLLALPIDFLLSVIPHPNSSSSSDLFFFFVEDSFPENICKGIIIPFMTS
jgi:hypothetical protein